MRYQHCHPTHEKCIVVDSILSLKHSNTNKTLVRKSNQKRSMTMLLNINLKSCAYALSRVS